MPLLLTPRSPRGGGHPVPAPLRRDAGTIIVGRDPRSDLVLDHPSASSRHCAIVGSGAAWQVQDSSTNGTTVNGQRITGARALRHGDVIGIATIEIAVALAEAAQPQPAAAPPPSAAAHWGQAAAPPQPQQRPAGSAEAVTRAAVAGLVRLNDARRKARAELGAPPSADPNDPFGAGGGDAVLARLLLLPQPAASAAVNDACEALAAHERALLTAMQATFRTALDHFSPVAIKQRTKSDAEAWKAYERAFNAADGFVETFAQELAKAYRGAADR